MTKKEDLQQELLAKVKLGTKPSDIKRLKRSKSADDIAQIPDPPPLPNNNPPNHLLQDQLTEKQKLIEDLRKQLEIVNQELKETKQELDNSLAARVAGIKVFGQEHDKRVKVEKELNETIDEASSELMAGDDQVSKLRTKLSTANQQINQLQQDLNRERIKRGTSPVANSLDNLPNLNYLKYTLYSLLAIWFILLLNKKSHD